MKKRREKGGKCNKGRKGNETEERGMKRKKGERN
jgi:hypothetical protein